MAQYFSQVIAQALVDSGRPVITEFELYLLAQPILQSASYGAEKVRMVPTAWGQPQVTAMVRTLVKRKVLAPDTDFKKGVWHIVGSLAAASAEQAICLVDPFAYISHLSAMQRYGLSDRSPEALHMSTPARALWTEMREARTSETLSSAGQIMPPKLMRIGIEPTVRKRHVTLHETKHPVPAREIADERARIAAIGYVFVEMLDQPALCGGMSHVLDCFDRHAETWLPDIITAVEAINSPIIKVRSGYILDEMLQLEFPQISKWLGCAQRGGSRKLDPKAPYGSVYSEKWMIALNA